MIYICENCGEELEAGEPEMHFGTNDLVVKIKPCLCSVDSEELEDAYEVIAKLRRQISNLLKETNSDV